jgi:succinate dehydrogenase/fumarate reductase cytochrome b subunit
MSKEKIIKITRIAIGLILLSSVAIIFYPKPEEIIIFFIIGVAILIVLAAIRQRTAKEASINQNKSASLYTKIIDVLAGVFVIYFLIALRTSLWEKKLIFNIFDVRRGRYYAAITIGILLVILLYQIIFFVRYKKWPKLKTGDFTLNSRHISDEANELMSWIIFVLLLGVPFFLVIWILYFLFST